MLLDIPFDVQIIIFNLIGKNDRMNVWQTCYDLKSRINDSKTMENDKHIIVMDEFRKPIDLKNLLDYHPLSNISELILNKKMNNFYYEYLQNDKLNNLTFLKINKHVSINKDMLFVICNLKNLRTLYLPMCDDVNMITNILNNCTKIKKLYSYYNINNITNEIIEIMNNRDGCLYYCRNKRIDDFRQHPSTKIKTGNQNMKVFLTNAIQNHTTDIPTDTDIMTNNIDNESISDVEENLPFSLFD
jgi:hypothetical protein